MTPSGRTAQLAADPHRAATPTHAEGPLLVPEPCPELSAPGCGPALGRLPPRPVAMGRTASSEDRFPAVMAALLPTATAPCAPSEATVTVRRVRSTCTSVALQPLVSLASSGSSAPDRKPSSSACSCSGWH